ncbi:MAG: hypothetical protein QM426_03840, partial [Euryarchaeota archaeon]|nr:hypothetical protein [Euryarchaeota archaeon]
VDFNNRGDLKSFTEGNREEGKGVLTEIKYFRPLLNTGVQKIKQQHKFIRRLYKVLIYLSQAHTLFQKHVLYFSGPAQTKAHPYIYLNSLKVRVCVYSSLILC